MSDIADILERTASKLSQPGVWGQSCGPARGFHCVQTAAAEVALGTDRANAALAFLAENIGVRPDRPSIWKWNDAADRTLDEVLAKLREAAAKARAA